MNIKPDSSDAIAAFLANGGKITDCGSSMQQAKSLRQMRRDAEQTATDRYDSVDFRRRQALAIEGRQDGTYRDE